MSTEIGSFEAKTRFSELLRKVEQGEHFTITLRGRVVANLTPPDDKLKRRTEAVQALLNTPRIQGVSAEMVKEWINEGRQ